MSPYVNREQTQAKHFILRRYLQALSFKLLRYRDITYVDGFSGPWESKTADYSDTSFMIAINVLKDAQQQIFAATKSRPRIRCFFSENDPKAFEALSRAVAPHHNPEGLFEIETYCGKFEDATVQIKRSIGNSFPLIFIDPTGWTGYPFQKIKKIFEYPKCEVLINFMYDFVNRFVASQDETIIATLNPILGGEGWRDRLDKSLPRGAAVENLFRESLKSAGGFDYVISTKIDKSTADRPHFFLAFGTKSSEGLKAFRDTEYEALKVQAQSRGAAKERKREDRTGISDLFGGSEANLQSENLEELIAEQKELASKHICDLIQSHRSLRFDFVVKNVLQAFILRETNVKDICVDLARAGIIQNTWGGGNRKPNNEIIIQSAEVS